MNTASIIETLGDTTAVAALLGVRPSAVSNWKARGGIPPEHWLALVDAAKERDIKGVTYEALAAIAANRGTAAHADTPPQSAIGDSPSAKPGATA